MRFFALNTSQALGQAVASDGGFPLDPDEERSLSAGDHKAQPLVSVDGHEVFVLSSLSGNGTLTAGDKLSRLLLFLGTCRDHGAARLTAVMPYLSYSGSEQQTGLYAPAATHYVAELLEAMGTDRVVTLDAHNPKAFHDAFRCESISIDTCPLFAGEIASMAPGCDRPPVVLSPTPHGATRAKRLHKALTSMGVVAENGHMERSGASKELSVELAAGDIDGRSVFIFDDMIVGGSTMVHAVNACRAGGAAEIRLLATHALFANAAVALLAEAAPDSITVTDSTPLPDAAMRSFGDRLKVLSSAPLLSQEITRLAFGDRQKRVTSEPMPGPRGVPRPSNGLAMANEDLPKWRQDRQSEEAS